jgi:hypothetical protein
MLKTVANRPMFKKTIFIALLIFSGSMIACTSTQISTTMKSAGDILGSKDELTSDEVVAGLKEALVQGAKISTEVTSKTDGYFKNPEIKIPFPPEIEKIETNLRKVGLNKPVDDFILSINRAAEKAAIEAKPLFISAITNMTIEDAWGILKGDDTAATSYLRNATETELQKKFEPIIDDALNSVSATKYYEDMSTQYNRLPLVTKVETDLTAYVSDKAMDGLFLMLAKEEEKIREDPLARTTDLLKRVFSQQ